MYPCHAAPCADCSGMRIGTRGGNLTGESSGETTPAETEIPGPDIAPIDGGGRDFTFLGRLGDGSDYAFPNHEILAEEQTGDTMNDAVYKRNLFIEEKYNINIVALEEDQSAVHTKALNAIKAGDNTYDIIMPPTYRAFAMQLEGAFYNVNEIPQVDIPKPWWQGRVLDNFSIGGANFFLIGDINFSNFNATSAIFFNKKIMDEYSIPDIYKTVLDGKWTLDVMHEYSTKVTYDLDGDAKMTGADAYGFVSSNFGWQPLYYGCGTRIIDKDKDDIPYLAWDSEKNINIITKMTELLNDEGATLLVNQHPDLANAVCPTSKGYGAATVNTFTEDRALFWVEVMYGIYQVRDMVSDFGIVPTPKYDENQESYTSYVHTSHSSSIGVPVTNTDLALTGAILEDMAYQSYVNVRPAFYDITLKGKLARDEEIVLMLDIIYNNINPDLTLAMNASGLTIDSKMRSIFTEDRSDIVSLIAANKEANIAKIEANTEAILSLLK